MRVSPAKFLVLIVMSLVGTAASSYVFYIFELLHKQPLWCSSSEKILGAAVNCAAVLSSSYNNVYGINLDLLAILYFFVNLTLVFAIGFGSESVFRMAFRVLFVWRFLGILIVPYLITIEFVVLKAICIYCTIMHFAILIDFAIVTYFLFWKDTAHVREVEDGPESPSLSNPSMATLPQGGPP
jgi:uncharacterized membrane protein